MKEKTVRIILWLLVFLWGGLIFYFSSQDGVSTAEASERLARPIAKLMYDEPMQWQSEHIRMMVRKAAHMVLFFIFGILVTVAVRRHRISWLCAFGIIIGYGFFDEWHKQYIAGRHFQIEEAVLNMICGIAGILAVCLTERILAKGADGGKAGKI